MKKTKRTISLLGLICMLMCVSMVSMLNAPTSAYAGTAGSVIDSDEMLGNEEVDYGKWYYNRNSGIEVKQGEKMYVLNGFKGGSTDTGIKAKAAIPEGKGSIVEIEFNQLDLVGADNGWSWAGLVYGAQNGDEGKGAFWDCENKEGALHQWKGDGSDLKMVFYDSETGYKEDQDAAAATFKDGAGTVLEKGSEFPIDAPVLEDVIFREFYGSDGTYEFSIRSSGETVAQRKVCLQTNELRPNPGGHIGLTFMLGGSIGTISIKDMRIYVTESGDLPSSDNSAFTKLCSFYTDAHANEGLLDDYVYGNKGAADIALSDGQTVAFTKQWSKSNPLINRTRIIKSAEISETLIGTFTLKINEIRGDKTFGVMFGLDELLDNVGANNSVYFYFGLFHEGYGYGVDFYDDNGSKQTAVGLTALPQTVELSNITVGCAFSSDGTASFSIDGQEVYKSAVDAFDIDGYFGFAQTGAFTDVTNFVDVELVALNLKNRYYDRPETVEIFESFDDNEFNINDFYLESRRATGKGLYVEEGVLRFDGAGDGSAFTTRYSYSNFEYAFDVFAAQNRPKKNNAGETVAGASPWIGLGFGCEVEGAARPAYMTHLNGSFAYFEAATDSVTGVRTGNTVFRFMLKGKLLATVNLDKKFAFFDEDFDTAKKVTVRFRVVDGKFSLALKAAGDASYTEIYLYEYENGFSPKGHLSLYSVSNAPQDNIVRVATTLSIDNILIRSLDLNANTVSSVYKPNRLPQLGDSEYTDEWTYGAEQVVASNGSGCGSAVATMHIPLLAVLMLLAVAFLTFNRRGERK